MKTFIIASILLLNGCAIYQFESDNCKLSIYSMRGFEGVKLELDDKCALKSGAQSANNNRAIEIIDRLVK